MRNRSQNLENTRKTHWVPLISQTAKSLPPPSNLLNRSLSLDTVKCMLLEDRNVLKPASTLVPA